eukprot:gnl/MRDRNA2_/MRDRNA2_132067_c0_seq1.p1 gnl/MRDRNA2_/MRDRNA2_132067_c0~~gnl/MRDRNA2_/MRDRNA2_132067_c0_seq1.p1  ORF type:complete len:684 (-),score=147.31 gnl/MRDRNA2_/MRDRNA2_132067_c0_seq1:162-2000(-)
MVPVTHYLPRKSIHREHRLGCTPGCFMPAVGEGSLAQCLVTLEKLEDQIAEAEEAGEITDDPAPTIQELIGQLPIEFERAADAARGEAARSQVKAAEAAGKAEGAAALSKSARQQQLGENASVVGAAAAGVEAAGGALVQAVAAQDVAEKVWDKVVKIEAIAQTIASRVNETWSYLPVRRAVALATRSKETIPGVLNTISKEVEAAATALDTAKKAQKEILDDATEEEKATTAPPATGTTTSKDPELLASQLWSLFKPSNEWLTTKQNKNKVPKNVSKAVSAPAPVATPELMNGSTSIPTSTPAPILHEGEVIIEGRLDEKTSETEQGTLAPVIETKSVPASISTPTSIPAPTTGSMPQREAVVDGHEYRQINDDNNAKETEDYGVVRSSVRAFNRLRRSSRMRSKQGFQTNKSIHEQMAADSVIRQGNKTAQMMQVPRYIKQNPAEIRKQEQGRYPETSDQSVFAQNPNPDDQEDALKYEQEVEKKIEAEDFSAGKWENPYYGRRRAIKAETTTEIPYIVPEVVGDTSFESWIYSSIDKFDEEEIQKFLRQTVRTSGEAFLQAEQQGKDKEACIEIRIQTIERIWDAAEKRIPEVMRVAIWNMLMKYGESS